MQAIQQRCRPKHQVLVLKCYPRTTKGAVDVKPNSSELSYLLYYATSRRTKIQKVGSFLERKTASDVWHLRIGNVQVTLQILEALIEKNPKDLPLFAPNILTILDLILRSNDITMVESSIPTFKAFCTHHDASILLADQAYLAQFEAVVRHYASFASTRLAPGKTQPSKPVTMRWRNSGLEAIRAVASSDALSSIAGRQYDMMVPMVLENLWTDNEDFLDVLLQRVEVEEQVDTDRLLKRRTSVATVRTADIAGDTNPIALSGTATDVDKLAEEDIGVLAMQCLKQIFIAPSRSLIHSATTSLLEFVNDRISQGESVVSGNFNSGKDNGWAVKICSLLLRWAPVQERYIILVTTIDTLARSPLTDETLDQHITLAAMIASLLRSDASLIGLSVMDVLLSFIHHIKKLVQMPGDPAAAAALATSEGPLPGQQDLRSPTTQAAASSAVTVSSKRKELLLRLQQCIGDLATHVYYADQISDMVSTILFRLKPARTGGLASSTPPGEKSDDGQDSPQQSPQQHKDRTKQHVVESLFSLTVTKTAMLKSVKAILLVANPRTNHGGSQTLTRNRVPIKVWEGTHWLLRDPDGGVRKAYVDTLLTWLDRETTAADQEVLDDGTVALGTGTASSGIQPATRSGREAASGPTGSDFGKRALSSTSQRENVGNSNSNGVIISNGGSSNSNGKTRSRRSFFLSLLHLAIYDNALEFVEYETDLVLLHVLLNKLADRLGVNAVRYGLPMIFQLQESIQDVETPQEKVRLGSVVHGYFWTLTERFNFESSVVGRAIRNEITRRRSKHFWLEGIQVPPTFVELAGTPGMMRPQPRMPLHEIESEALLPFDDRLSLVECVSTAYYEAFAGSPPQSPSTNPGRGGSSGGLFPGFSLGNATVSANTQREVPAAVREEMLSDWSRDGVLQQMQQHNSSKSVSLSGSRSGTMATASNTVARSRLAINTLNGLSNGQLYFNGNGPTSPTAQQNTRPISQPARAVNGSTANDMLAAPVVSKLRKTSIRSGLSPSPIGSSSTRSGGGFVTSVDQLKLALTGGLTSPGLGRERSGDANDDDGSSDSMASYDLSASEVSFNPPLGVAAGQAQPSQQSDREPSSSPASVKRSLSAAARKNSTASSGQLGSLPSGTNSDADAEAVPPVPPLPSPLLRGQQNQQANGGYAGYPPVTFVSSDGRPATASPGRTSTSGGVSRRNVRSRGGESVLSSLINDELPASAGDLDSLLKGIDSRAGEHSFGNVSRPPY
ncbi:protein efr3 [Grosmannia clavigera kw1407]|uniref:Protein efr3 n=1 Tax=Grosmannia clavigera (strain kw1407 / UAMH 11150) TaxID=655863 RepID=F0XT68_GROCL|nr:protein efr3 [Grosmannia clavigera kw1407]EFW99351.1 protein efr3 [Grosmannia clavigera kw1407]